MTRTLVVRLEEIEGSLGFIVPIEIVKEKGLQEGDVVEIAIQTPSSGERKKGIEDLVGSHKGTTPFQRDRDDRY